MPYILEHRIQRITEPRAATVRFQEASFHQELYGDHNEIWPNVGGSNAKGCGATLQTILNGLTLDVAPATAHMLLTWRRQFGQVQTTGGRCGLDVRPGGNQKVTTD